MAFAFLVVVIPTTAASAQTSELAALRVLYYRASNEMQAANEFYGKLKSIDETRPLWLGYKGMASFMLARHVRNPLSKLKHFLEGQDILEKSIKLAPANLELRYLRFSVQTSAPEFLNYRRNILQDKKILLEALFKPKIHKLDEDLRQRIVRYMLETKYCTGREKEDLARVRLTFREDTR